MQEFIKVMKALSDPNRVMAVKLLQRREMCVCEIQACLELAQSTVSKHMRLLESAGLVTSYKEGLWVNYRLADGAGSPYVANLLGNLRHWLEVDPDVLDRLGRIDGLDRHALCGR